MRDPLPNELLIEAWKAIVGAERERCFTHRAYIRSVSSIAQQTLVVGKENKKKKQKRMCDTELRDPD